MINLLPLRHLTEADQPLFGANLFNLAQLARSGLPVLPGIALTPPKIVLNVVLKHFQQTSKEVFEERLAIAQKELIKIPVQEELAKELSKHHQYFLPSLGKSYSKKEQLWQALLQRWVEEISGHIWEQGLGVGVVSKLSPQVIFFVHDDFSQIRSYWNPETKEAVVEARSSLPAPLLQKIEQLVSEANKKLFLPQVYKLVILEGRVYIAGLSPFTQVRTEAGQEELVLTPSKQRVLHKSAVKVFLDLSLGLTLGENLDGIFLEGERIEGFDQLVFRLVEGALSMPHKPVIYKLPDIVDREKIRGALRLINQQSLLKQSASTFIFARNKKTLLNLELAIPFTRSKEELLQLKRELAALGINRKGSLKFWQEMAVPENFINLEEYLEVGIDGVILNLDELQKFLGGYEVAEGEFYKKQIQTLIKFLTPAFKLLHKNRVPVLAKGELLNVSEMLDFLMESGAWGVVVNTPLEADSLPQHLGWLEKRIVEKRLTTI